MSTRGAAAIDDTTAAGRLSAAEKRFELWRKRAGGVVAPIAFFAAYAGGRPLTPEGRTLAGVLASVGTLWISEALPLPVSALLGASLCVVLGVADVKTVLAHFADPVVFVFIGGFMLARAMTVHRLDRRLALTLLSQPWVSASPARVLAALGVATAGISMWVSNTATTAMMLPIAVGVLGAIHEARVARGEAMGPLDARRWPFATATMLMIAYGASIGGIGTPVGSPPNLIGIGLIAAETGVAISFFKWMALCAPMLGVMGIALYAILWRSLRDDPSFRRGDQGAGIVRPVPRDDGKGVNEALLAYIRSQRLALGPMSRGEKNALVAFGVAVLLWTLPGILEIALSADHVLVAGMKERLPESVVALVAALLLFMLPVDVRRGEFTLTWRQAEQIEWGVILLFGGGMALGSLMFSTGVARALGEGMAAAIGVQSLWGLTAAAIAMAIVLSESASNTASANMIIPVVIAIAQSAGVSPVPPALGACLGASFGFMLPVSTPPNAIVYGSGLVPLGRMMRAGVVFDVVGFVIIWCGLRVMCPLLGLV